MAEFWTVLVVLFTLFESIASDDITPEELSLDLPLSKSLGYSIQKKLDTKTLSDANLNREFLYQYKEMLKASQESFENFDKPDDRRLRRVVGEHNYRKMKEAGVLDRRRNAPRFESPIGRRRARNQALRRHKLNSQSLKSHLYHSRETTPEYLHER